MENPITFQDLAAKYLNWCSKHRSPRSLELYEGHINNFLKYIGPELSAVNMKPFHVVEWVDSSPTWGDTYKRGGIVAIQRVYNWATEMGYLDINPILKVKKPPAKRRNNHMKPEDYDNILNHLKDGDPFKELLIFAWLSGARPQEVRHIESRHVDIDAGRITFPAIESKGKRHPRTIYLLGETLEIIRRLDAQYPDGKLFRNTRGDEWTKYALCNRMHRLSKLTGKRMAMYDARHGFATRKLKQGHDGIVVGGLMGHVDGSMVAKIYQHVTDDAEFLKKALIE